MNNKMTDTPPQGAYESGVVAEHLLHLLVPPQDGLGNPAACVFCGSTDETTGWLDNYGLGVVDGVPVEACVCQDCTLLHYDADDPDADPDPDPEMFIFTSVPQAPVPYVVMTRRALPTCHVV